MDFTPDIVSTFIDWKKPSFDGNLLGIWLTAAIGAITAFLPELAPIVATSALLGGGFQTLGYELQFQ